MQKIYPCLWFDTQAEEAMNFYLSVFKNSQKGGLTYYPEGGPKPKGTVATASFTLNGQDFLALNGGPGFSFSYAVSLVANCDSQQEIDELWEKLSEGGSKERCGWVKDKFGLSWQIVPANLSLLLDSSNPAAAQRVMSEVWKMDKLDMAALEAAAE